LASASSAPLDGCDEDEDVDVAPLEAPAHAVEEAKDTGCQAQQLRPAIHVARMASIMPKAFPTRQTVLVRMVSPSRLFVFHEIAISI